MKLFLWLSALLMASHLLAQESCKLVVTGKVIDEHDGKPLSFADLLVLDSGAGTTTSEKGEFRLDGVCPGEITIRVSHIGCESQEQTFSVVADTVVSFFLEHHTQFLEMVEVEATKPHEDIAGRTELALEKIQRNEGQSLAELLDDLQGVQSMKNGGNIAKPMIHGLHSNRIVIVHQDTRVEGQQWGGEHAPELDPFTTEELEVVQGASSLRYGPEALAGVIISKSSSLVGDTALNGWLHMGGASNGRRGALAGKVQGAFHKRIPLFFQLQGSLSRGGDLRAPNYYLDNTGNYERNWQARLSFGKPKLGMEAHYAQFNTDLGILSYAHIGNLTDLERAIELEIPIGETEEFSYEIGRPNQHVEHELTAWKGWWRPLLGTKIEANVSRQYNLRQEFDRSIFSGEDPDLQYEITTWQGDVNLEHRWSAELKTELGAAGQSQANTIEGRFFIPNFQSYQIGGYAIQHVQFSSWEMEVGVRFDQKWLQAFMFREDTLYEPELTFSGFSWNLGFGYFGDLWKFSSNVARGWRAPAINELYSAGLHHGTASVEFGNENLIEERLFSWTNQFTVRNLQVLGRPLKGSVTGYVNYFDQFIYLVPTLEATLTIRGAFPTFEYLPTEALFRGVDFNAEYELARSVSLQLGGEVVRASNPTSGEDLLFIPADRFDLGLVFGPGKRKDAPYLGVGATGVVTQTRYPRDVDYAPPPEGYVLANAEIGGTFHLSSTSFIFSFRVENVANTAYRSYINRLRYFADEPGRNFIFSLRVPFSTARKQSN